MANKRGRPKGSTTRPQFYTYIDENDRREFVKWIRENWKYDPYLVRWYGEQMFGKAPQPLVGGDGNELHITGVEISVRK